MLNNAWAPDDSSGHATFHVNAGNGCYTITIVFDDETSIGSPKFENLEHLIAWAVSCVGNYLSTRPNKCKCLYESDCHGIEMIKSPTGEEWAIGGTQVPDRWKFCPWCGGSITNKK